MCFWPVAAWTKSCRNRIYFGKRSEPHGPSSRLKTLDSVPRPLHCLNTGRAAAACRSRTFGLLSGLVLDFTQLNAGHNTLSQHWPKRVSRNSGRNFRQRTTSNPHPPSQQACASAQQPRQTHPGSASSVHKSSPPPFHRGRHRSRTAWPSANPCRSARSHPAVKKTKREPKHRRCLSEKRSKALKSIEKHLKVTSPGSSCFSLHPAGLPCCQSGLSQL